jgi:hypothetical protein
MNTVHNARVQLLSTALNNLGVGAIIAGAVAPMVSGKPADPGHLFIWLVFGVDLIAFAQFELRRLR